jgi:hypothetical protein
MIQVKTNELDQLIITGIKHGLYKIYWKSGGNSLAAVGFDREGSNWYAPCNWTSGVSIDWTGVKGFRLIKAIDYDGNKSVKFDGNLVKIEDIA